MEKAYTLMQSDIAMFVVQLNDFAKKLPKDLFFVLRSTNIVSIARILSMCACTFYTYCYHNRLSMQLRSVSLALGGTSVQRFKINAAAAIKGTHGRIVNTYRVLCYYWQKILAKDACDFPGMILRLTIVL